MSNKQVISEWFYQYSDDIYQFLFFQLGAQSNDVDDLVQEVFIRALKGLSNFNGSASPKTWLYSIARNIAIDEQRKRKREKWKAFLSPETHYHNEPKSNETPEALYFLSEKQQELIASIQTLKESYQEVLVMRGIKGLTVPETAEILGWSENKVRSTHYRAKTALHAKMGGD